VFAAGARADLLPGFRVERVASVAGFCSSIAVDSRGAIYYTTTKGTIVRVGDEQKIVKTVVTEGIGNSGLLGMALIEDRSAVIHYTRPNQTYDVVSLIDLETGSEKILHEFAGDIGFPLAGISPEHHGGNPTVGDDGAIYVGIGDYGALQIAANPMWNGGKIFRIERDGTATQIARGFRNTFDVAWDAERHRLIAPDNGDAVDDEINIISGDGGFFGWPYTMGGGASVDGSIAPAFVFSEVIAPTGIARLAGRNAMLKRGYLLGAFVTRALYFIEDIDDPNPIAIVSEFSGGGVIDVVEGRNGEIYFATGTTIYQLIPPRRGDANGDGVIDFGDVSALERELADGGEHDVHLAQDGLYRASWGSDADGDGMITSSDRGALLRLLTNRFPAVRRGR
jgi:hypothetical protein